MYITNKQPVIGSDKYIFRFNVSVNILCRVYLGDSTKQLKHEPLLFN